MAKDKKCRSSCFWNGIFLNLLTHIPEQQLHAAVGNEPELVGVRPLHLAGARPLCRLKAPLGLSLLRNRGILISDENKKSEPFSHREKVRIFIVWCDREDSNLWPSGSEPNALSS